MQLRILGAHSLETRGARLTSLLVDGRLALDAGSLTRSLTLQEQSAIRAVFLSHRHFDHVRDLLTLGLNTRDDEQVVQVWATEETGAALKEHLLNGVLYPNPLASFKGRQPKYSLRPITPHRPEDVLGYTVVALPVPHGAPAVACHITAPDGRRLFFSGDTSPGLHECWPEAQADMLAIEVSYPNQMEALALDAGHLTPLFLQRELEAYGRLYGDIPPVVAIHMHPAHQEAIEEELAKVSAAVDASILIGREDMTLMV